MTARHRFRSRNRWHYRPFSYHASGQMHAAGSRPFPYEPRTDLAPQPVRGMDLKAQPAFSAAIWRDCRCVKGEGRGGLGLYLAVRVRIDPETHERRVFRAFVFVESLVRPSVWMNAPRSALVRMWRTSAGSCA
jgi:hypothetical protein